MIWPLVLVVLLGVSPAWAEALPSALYGEWHGTALTVNEGSDDLGVSAEDLSVRIDPDGNGFRMRWTGFTHEGADGPLVRRPIEARFTPTNRPGVFAFNPEQSSILLRLFGDPSTNNPLKGEPLLWARFDGDTLSVYGLVIDERGGFDLYQHIRTLTDDDMMARYTQRTQHGLEMTLEGRLQRAGG